MARRALVIGSQTYDLKGVLWDAERMTAMLEKQGFTVDVRVGQNATREGILEGYERLIRSCSEGDNAVVYFSGHGGRVLDPSYRPDGQPRFSSHNQFIVPEDFAASRDGDFRGITAHELSALQARLTTVTPNVAVILDCCYATGMSRAPGAQVKAMGFTSYGWISAHLEQLRTRGVALGSPHMEGNPHAVRLVASGVDEPAFEFIANDGRWAGALTDALLEALEEVGPLPVTWELIGRRSRERVIAKPGFQRPEIEGPVHRIAFGLGEVPAAPGLPYFSQEGRHFLRGGRLHGVCVGDEYLVMPFPASAADPAHGLARARVVQIASGVCEVALTPLNGQVVISAGSPAFLVRPTRPRRGVLLIEDGTEGFLVEQLRSQLAASGLVRSALEDERAPLLATARFEAGFIELRDRNGCRVAYPFRVGMEAVLQVVQATEALARAQALRELESGTGAHALKDEVSVEWGIAEGGAPRRCPRRAARLRPGQRVYLRLVNDGRERRYASVFDLGVAGRITQLNRSQPSGMLLEPERDAWLGVRQNGELMGLALHWPETVPPDAPGIESIIIIISDQPQDLRLLESGRDQARAGVASPLSLLQRWLEQLAWGRSRDTASLEEGRPVAYSVQSLEFNLECPKPSSSPERTLTQPPSPAHPSGES